MVKIEIVRVKRSQEASARDGVFFERDFVHRQANPEEWPDGEVWIADDDEHVVARTFGVQAAIRIGRLVTVVVETPEPEPEPEEDPDGEPEEDPDGEPEEDPDGEPEEEPEGKPEEEPEGKPEEEPEGKPEEEPELRSTEKSAVKTVEVRAEDVDATDPARELAEKAGVDLAEVPPSGKDGQVVMKDVQSFIKRAKG